MHRIKKKTRDGVFAYKGPRGQRWGADYRDPTTQKRRRRAGFTSKAAALEWKDRMERQAFGLAPVESPITFATAVERYLDHRVAQGKSIDSYWLLVLKSKVKRTPGFWTKHFGTRPLSSIRSEEIEAVLDSATKTEGWTPATRNRALAQLGGLLSYAYGRGWIADHPTANGRVPRLSENNVRTRWLRLHEVEAIAQASPPWLQVIVRFAVATGMRLGEITSLTRASYQTDEQGQGYVVTERTKNGERLAWPLEGWALDYVRERVEAARFPGDHIFPAPRGGNAYAAIQRELPAVIEKAGLRYGRKHPDGITFHVFRHTMASLAINAHIPESTVQRMGNWKTRTMVGRYAHYADESLREAAARLVDLVKHGAHGGSRRARQVKSN